MVLLLDMQTSQNYIIDFPKAHSNKQALIMNFFTSYPECKDLFVSCGSKFGKAEKINNLIPTPNGFKTMQNICVGDSVFNEHGKPIKVIGVTDVMHDRDCYEVVFSDDSKVEVDGNHLWLTTTSNERKNMSRCVNSASKPQVRTTLEIMNTLLDRRQAPNHSIDLVTNPVEFNKASLPIHPYVLGVWLGDGSIYGGQYCKPDVEIADRIRTFGYNVKKNLTKDMWTIEGLTTKLKKYNFTHNKHVPDYYLIASVEQRKQLLQGLMDTDGTVDKRGNCTFDNTVKDLVDAVEFLCNSLGIKTNRSERIGKLYGVEKKLCYRVWFTTDIDVFSLPRKLSRIRSVTSKSHRRYIVAVNKVKSEPVKCIKVDSPTQLYLTSKRFIVTHNTISAAASINNGLINSRNAYWRWVAPIYEQARIGFDYCKKMLPIGDGFEAKDSRLAILCPELDSQIRYYHAHKADSLEGFATAGGVFDEAAKISKEAYDADNTTRSRTRSKRIYVSTPIGKNHFYNSCMEAKEEMILAKRQLRVPRMMFITAATFDNPYIPKESIEDMRRRLPDRLFRQYIMADFIDDADVFGNYRQCFEGQPIVFDSDDSHWFADTAKNSTVVVGADWARTRDYTVFIAIDVEHKRVVGFRRFHKRSYIEAVRELVRFCKLFKETQTVWHDKTGVGVALDDQLAYTDLSYKGVTFSNQSKSSMINSLITTFEHRSIVMPYLSVLDKELGAYEIKVNDIGTMTYNAPSGMHDDTVMALVLAHAALMQYSDLRYEVRFLEDLRGDAELSKLTPLEQYYSDID